MAIEFALNSMFSNVHMLEHLGMPIDHLMSLFIILEGLHLFTGCQKTGVGCMVSCIFSPQKVLLVIFIHHNI